ncbi:MAG: hypothetical protein ACOY0T_23210 [Myxococcota bacterium]
MKRFIARVFGVLGASLCAGFSACSDAGDAGGSGGNTVGGGVSGASSATGRGGFIAIAGGKTSTAAGGQQHGGHVATNGGSGPAFGGASADAGMAGAPTGGSNASAGAGGATHAGGRVEGGGGSSTGGTPCCSAGAGAAGDIEHSIGGESGNGGAGGRVDIAEGGAAGRPGDDSPPGCVRPTYAVPVKVRAMVAPNCSFPVEYMDTRHVNVFHDSSAGWLVDFPDSPSAGPYLLRETETGYAAGSTSAPMGVPLIGWSVNCSTGLVQVSGISGDCLTGTGSFQFSGQTYECALWAAFEGSSSHFIGATLFLRAYGTCRQNATYRFTLTRPDQSVSVVQDWSPSNSFTWNTASEKMGNYAFVVSVRSEGLPDESVTMPYYLIPPP